MLLESAGPLGREYATLLVDLDGVVYRGKEAVPHAADLLAAHRADGGQAFFVTNNASRTPADVAQHLRELNVDAQPGDVVTSVQATAAVLAEKIHTGEVPAGAAALVVGADALADALREIGLRPVSNAAEDPAVVVQGFSPDIAWPLLAEAAYAIRAGARWFATNSDATLPTEHGLAPGNGSLIAALATATGQQPMVMGKPERPLFDTALQLTGAERSTTLVVGDRLDSDILGASNAELASLLVLTGVSTVRDLLVADGGLRPDYVAFDLRALREAQSPVRLDGHRAQCGGFTAEGDVARPVSFSGNGEPSDALRAVAACTWSFPPGTVDVDRVCDQLEALRP
jgi:HAD superfamily hydrolase (TIGR01457 family)